MLTLKPLRSSARHLEAIALVTAAHLLIETAGWDRARRIADAIHTRSRQARSNLQTADPLPTALAVERSVMRASRLIPFARCAPRALAARQMLAHRRTPARLIVGLRLDPRPEGHAWLEIGDPLHPILLFARPGHRYQPVDALSTPEHVAI